jgi:hypothetical protein
LAVGAGATFEELLMVVLRYLDVALVLLVAVPALALGAPAFGYGVGAAAWILQRVIGATDKPWMRKATQPQTLLALNLFEAFARIWLMAGAIVLAGLAGARADGLTAALVIFGAYSVAFVIRVFSGPPQGKRTP